MESCKLSIVMPVYNSALYLNESINSILLQTYCNFELIIVNDGSSDDSERICMEYLKSDSRVKLINKKNEGVSSARNDGLDSANGDILLFVDSDDILEPNALQIIVDNIGDNDILCFGYKQLYKDKRINFLYDESLSGKEQFEKMVVMSDKVAGYLWNKVFRTSIIKENKLKLNKDLHYCEDMVFVVQYLKYCKKVRYINKCLYLYRMRKSSVSFNFFDKKNISILNSNNYLINMINDKMLINKLKYNYILNYYRLKKNIPKDFNVKKEILNKEKEILKLENLSLKNKIQFFLVKKVNWLYRILREIKNKKLNLYE